jgi:hypothetical protein
MNTLIRKALTSDLGALVELSRRTISASYRRSLADEAVDAFLGSGAADRYVEESIDRCGDPLPAVGELTLESFEDNENEASGIRIRAARRGRGGAVAATPQALARAT